MSVSLPPHKLADIQWLALSLLWTQHLTVCRVTCYVVTILPPIYFHVFIFLSSLHQLEQLSHLQQNLVPLQFPLPDMVIATDATPTHWTFYFQGSGLPLSVSGSWMGSLFRAHIALQELQAIVMILCRMTFCLSDKAVALCLDNSTAKAYLCNKGGTVSPFLSRLACRIPALNDKHGITLIPAYIPTHLNMEADYLSWDWLLPEWQLLPQRLMQPFAFGAFQRWTCWHLLVPLNGSIITPWKLHYLWGALGLNAFSHPWTFQVSYVFPPAALVPLVLSKFLAEHVNSQLRHLILVAPCWIQAPSLPTILNMLANVPQWCPIVKDVILDVSVGKALKGLQYLYLTLWQLSNVCYVDRGSLPWSIRQWQEKLKYLHQRSTSSDGRNGQVGVIDRVYQSMPSLPQISQFLLHLFQVGLAWFKIGIYCSAISAYLQPYLLHKASNHPVIAKLMHHSYLHCPPHKQIDPWDVEHLLSLLERWTSVSSLTTIKLAWKTATLLALVTVKHCSDLTLLFVDNQHLFFSIMLPFSFPCLVARQIIWVIFPFRFILSLIAVLIFALFFLFEGLF